MKAQLTFFEIKKDKKKIKSEIGKMRFKGGVIKETKTKFLTMGNAITVLCVIIAPMFQKADPVYEL